MWFSPDEKFLRFSIKLFKVLAWVALIVQVVMGFILVVTGGEAVPIGGLDVPARVIGLLNLVAAVVYFFMFMLISAVIRLLVELHAQVTKGGSSSG